MIDPDLELAGAAGSGSLEALMAVCVGTKAGVDSVVRDG